RLFYDGFLKDTASMGSPGIDELRWMKPVRPGDTLSARLTILEATPSRSKPDRGIIRSLMEMRNQHGEVVMTTTGVNFFSRRRSAAGREGPICSIPALVSRRGRRSTRTAAALACGLNVERPRLARRLRAAPRIWTLLGRRAGNGR